jgi:tetratricopeptide (TPR) repeat protein
MRATVRTLTLVFAATSSIWAQAVVARAQSSYTEQDYHTLVTAYRDGDRDAVRRLQEWPLEQLARVVDSIEVPGRFRWDPNTIVAAVKLHTEALLQPPAAGPAASVTAYRVSATVLLGKAPSSVRAFASRWYVAMTRLSCDSACGTLAADLLKTGRQQLPGDGAVLCESGRLLEYIASSLRNLGPTSPTELAGEDEAATYRRVRSKRDTLLKRGAEWLRAGAAADGSDSLCRLHLARVQSLRGDDADAGSLLRELQQDRDDAVSYLASMFLGGAAERRGELADAERFYRAAIARFPLGQAAYVALSSVLLRSGATGPARESLARSVNEVADDRRDPWWWYHLDPTSAVYARIEDLLKEGR